MSQMTPDQLRARAEAGDAKAQYALAGMLSASGDKAGADRWLQAAADQEEPDALYTLATRMITDTPSLEAAAAQLDIAAEKGSAPAHRLRGAFHAEGFGGARDWRKAVAHTIKAARLGDGAAMRDLALALFAQDPDHTDGQTLIDHASRLDAAAAAIYVRRAALGRRGVNGAHAAAALSMLEKIGYPAAINLRQVLNKALSQTKSETRTAQEKAPAAAPAPDWDRIANLAEVEPRAFDAPQTVLSSAPRATTFTSVFSPEECEYIIAEGARRLAPSLIVDPQTGQSRKDPHRTSLTAIMGIADLDLTLAMINRRLAAIADIDVMAGEFLSVLRYERGQEYRPHFDWLPPGAEQERSGQRIATALIYLNDDYEGGETWFETPDISHKGAVGDVLLFRNVTENGAPDPQSRHAGLPVKSGAKWLGSKWFREKEYQF